MATNNAPGRTPELSSRTATTPDPDAGASNHSPPVTINRLSQVNITAIAAFLSKTHLSSGDSA
jgi:hypothetical protein